MSVFGPELHECPLRPLGLVFRSDRTRLTGREKQGADHLPYLILSSIFNTHKKKSVALHRHSHAVVGLVPAEADSSVMNLAATEKPNVS